MAEKSVTIAETTVTEYSDDNDKHGSGDSSIEGPEEAEDEETEGETLDEEEEPQIFIERELLPYEQAFFNEMQDEEFSTYINNFVSENTHLALENRVFENFLKLNEPCLLSGIPQALQTIQELEQTQPLWPSGLEDPDYVPPAPTLKTLVLSDKGNRINLAQRTDLVLRVVEEMQISLTAFMEKAKKTKFRLKAEIEESAARIEDIELSRAAFQQDVVIDGVDPITQRIPAEKFVWTIQDWLRSAGILAEKLRLRNSSLITQYIKLRNLLLQKMELGECISEVDFEQMRIQNKCLAEKIDQKNVHLLELKKMNGKANLNLATHKIYLEKIINGLKTMRNAIDETVIEKHAHEKECIVAEKEVGEAESRYRDVKNLTENYKVPEVLDYVRVKNKLHGLKKDLKILERKENINKIVFRSTIKQMQQLTGYKKVNPRWFVRGENFSGFNDDLDEEVDINGEPISKYPGNPILPEFDILTVLKKTN